MKKFRIITKLIASFLMLVLGSNQAAIADEGVLDFAVPHGDVVISTPKENNAGGQRTPGAGESVKIDSPLLQGSPSSLFATKRSPGAIAVGSAEGNLTPAGQTTSIYFGHIDPGNHVVNRGFCSWNKAASLSVAEADRRCILALQWQSAKTSSKLTALGLDPKNHTYALVNGTDLWNQSNSAGPQFPIKYKKALDKGLKGSRALLDARVEAFRSSGGVLNATGLFGICATQPYYKSRLVGVAPYSEAWRWRCIALDQGRRIRQVDKALKLNFGDTSTYSDPIPEAVPSLKSLPGAREILPELPTSDSPALNFDPVVAPLPIAPATVSKETQLALPKVANSFSSAQSAISSDKSQLDFRETPQNEDLKIRGDGERIDPNSPVAPSTSAPSKDEATGANIESWGSDLKKTLGLGEKVAGYEVSSTYGMRIHPLTGRSQFHAGVDLKTPTNTPLYAIGQPETLTTLRCWTDPGGGGLVGTMTSPSFPNLQFEALHLSWCKAPTNSFQIKVKAGEVIAGTGSTGYSTGPHLHFQVRDKQTGKRIPPAKGFTSWVITGKEP